MPLSCRAAQYIALGHTQSVGFSTRSRSTGLRWMERISFLLHNHTPFPKAAMECHVW